MESTTTPNATTPNATTPNAATTNAATTNATNTNTTTFQSKLCIAYWGSFVCGLGLANQHTIILYEIPLILIVLVHGIQRKIIVSVFYVYNIIYNI